MSRGHLPGLHAGRTGERAMPLNHARRRVQLRTPGLTWGAFWISQRAPAWAIPAGHGHSAQNLGASNGLLGRMTPRCSQHRTSFGASLDITSAGIRWLSRYPGLCPHNPIAQSQRPNASTASHCAGVSISQMLGPWSAVLRILALWTKPYRCTSRSLKVPDAVHAQAAQPDSSAPALECRQ